MVYARVNRKAKQALGINQSKRDNIFNLICARLSVPMKSTSEEIDHFNRHRVWEYLDVRTEHAFGCRICTLFVQPTHQEIWKTNISVDFRFSASFFCFGAYCWLIVMLMSIEQWRSMDFVTRKQRKLCTNTCTSQSSTFSFHLAHRMSPWQFPSLIFYS